MLDVGDRSIHIDDWVDFDQLASVVDYLRSLMTVDVPSLCAVTTDSYGTVYDLRETPHTEVMKFCQDLARVKERPFDLYYGQYVRNGKIVL